MGFAEDAGFDTVQAVCRSDEHAGPEGRARLFERAGFDLGEPVQNLAPAQISLEDWEARLEAGAPESDAEESGFSRDV
jgi:hypothetical protein